MTDDADERTANRWLRTARVSAEAYDERYDQRAAAGENVHGEADLVMRFAPASVLDAGCGTGRIARELHRRGVEAVGVDIDPQMLAVAQRRSPAVGWHLADLVTVDLGRTFDVVLLAGNVLIFLTPGSEGDAVANMARHLATDGVLIAGFQLEPGRLRVEDYDALCDRAGLRLVERWATWEHGAWDVHATYAVSVHAPGASRRYMRPAVA